MKQFAAYAAAALLAAPVCMVAHASDADVFVDQTIELVNNLSAILDRVTPENAEQMTAEVLALKPQADKLKQLTASMSEEDNRALESNTEATKLITDVMVGLIVGMNKLQAIMEDENTTLEQKAAIQQLEAALDSVLGVDEDAETKD